MTGGNGDRFDFDDGRRPSLQPREINRPALNGIDFNQISPTPSDHGHSLYSNQSVAGPAVQPCAHGGGAAMTVPRTECAFPQRTLFGHLLHA